MLDRLLYRMLWLVTLSLITLAGAGGLLLGYAGLRACCAGHIPAGITSLTGAVALSVACCLLCLHANDLMDR